ncbi:filamentous hemagglutinin N-terminal domain-containing protein [Azospirillum melinis]|uniref:Filamentous hemagglutinin N-terminal domain-containing protein n=1 Tax=Azospirillum melinis TaxID=328839 RepID=A0ABX2KLI6_9PROT|nr:filamentous hemagglutinin N-terminal domain-containing protein [Azospirillum melinis]
MAGAARLAILAAFLALPLPARANPEGGVVTDGAATIHTTAPGRLDIIQSTPKAVIDWQRFGIAEGEHTNFQQPDTNAITLNRVTGSDPSAILGRLTANGQVWLVNPNGILFGPNARVDVGGLVATTHDIRNADFMAGRYNFEGRAGSTATVENEGTITVAQAGLAALVAPGVANRGTIQARMGEVTLASGRRFVVDLFGDQKINIAVDAKTDARPVGADGKPVEALVSNSGKIFADGGRVQMTASAAKGLVDRVVNMSGTVQARRVEQQGGDIVLLGDGGDVEVSGSIDASGSGASGNGGGQTGGSVTVSGNRTALTATARVTASGPAGGGEVLIGGDVQGGRASAATLAGYNIRPARKPVPPSTETIVAHGSTIAADATENGKGGKVVVWADGSTRFDGAVSARGGAAGGNGGFVETSGKLSLHVRGSVDAAAGTGQGTGTGVGGFWLLDPTDITVAATGGTITADSIQTSLNGGTSVTLQTDASGTDAGDITIDQEILKTAGGDASLTLKAHRNIVVNQSIVSTAGALTLTLNAATGTGNGIVRTAATSGTSPIAITTNGGAFIVGGGSNPAMKPATGISGGYSPSSDRVGVEFHDTIVSTGAGSILINGHGGENNGDGNHGIALYDSQLTTGTGSITLNGEGGNGMYYGDNVGVLLSSSALQTGGGAVSITGTEGHGEGSQGNDAIRVTDDSSIAVLGNGAIDIRGGANSSRDILLSGAVIRNGNAPITLESGGSLFLDYDTSLTSDGTVTLRAASGISLMDSHIVAADRPVTLNSNRSGYGGAISLGSSSIATADGDIVLGGGSDPASMAAKADYGDWAGVSIANSSLYTGHGSISIRGEGEGYGNSTHGVLINGSSTIGAATGKIAIHGKTTSQSDSRNAGVLIESNVDGGPTVVAGSTAADAILIDGDASEADSIESWGVMLQGRVGLLSSGGVSIRGKGGASSADFEVAGIGLDAESDGNIQIVAAAGEVSLQGTAGTAGPHGTASALYLSLIPI